MYRVLLLFVVVLCVLCLFAPPAALAQEQAVGVVEPAGFTICNQGTHVVRDPCIGAEVLIQSAGSINLNAFLNDFVIVEGFDVGVEPGCRVLEVYAVAYSSPACNLQVTLTVSGGGGTVLLWGHSTWRRYDLIRGELPLEMSGSAVNLGQVVCLADDLTGSSWGTDTETPLPGEAFFYLVRVGSSSYGFSTSGSPEAPASGDCPVN